MPILNYTTKIRPDRTVSEIQKMLGSRAASVQVDYADGRIAAVSFALVISGQRVQFKLPAKVDGVLAVLKRQRVPRQYQTRDHAESVSWRIVKDWCAAQLALIDAGQAEMSEVFLPYVVVGNRTLFQQFEAQVARGLLTGRIGTDDEPGDYEPSTS
jgi:hypothetical protein